MPVERGVGISLGSECGITTGIIRLPAVAVCISKFFGRQAPSGIQLRR